MKRFWMLIVMVDLGHDISQTRRMYSTKSEAYRKLQTLGNDVSVGLLIVTNVPLCWWTGIMGDAVHMWGQKVYGKSVFKFCCEPTIALKK